MTNSYDTIILGGGALGSAAAYHLAKSGQRVLLLEQFEFDHQKGSSYGLSRIIRYAYDYPQYVELAKAVYPMWADFETETGETFYTRTGGVDFGRGDEASLNAVIQCLTVAEIDHELFTPAEAQEHFPQFHFDDDMKILYQRDSGILSASKVVRSQLRMAEQYGAVLKSHTSVTKIIPQCAHVEVVTATGRYSADRLVITAGGWLGQLLQDVGIKLPLKPMRCQEIYFDTDKPELYTPDQFPAFIAHLKDTFPHMPYGIASIENSGLKASLHGGKLYQHPSEIDYQPDQEIILETTRFLHQYLPGATSLRSARVCLYTMTPDEHWIIDHHPEYPHIVFAGGCSGHAFKFCILIGKILAEMTMTGTTQYDTSLFTIKRFETTDAE
jgi:sarcosine oxidase